MEKDDFQKELIHFNEVEGIIRNKLEKLYREKAPLQERLLRERKEMWEDNRHLIRDFDDVIFLNTQETIVKSVEQQLAWNEADIQQHTKMEKSPYFGRVDFQEEAGEADTIYIGVYSLTDEESQEIYVVDWRAPISSMFYQFDAGPAWYEVHGHKNQVEITGKRQYRIEDGRLLSVYDTDSSMYDDILVQALSEYSDHKLKVIAGSIQREQNAAIRSDTKSSCLIYGLAGSGKTSIGLHRLAYVLYRDRETIKSENILILSNNNIFGSYISTILPDLGEKPAQTKVFGDFLEAFLGEGLEIEDYYSQLKSIEGPYAEERIKWIQIKYSAELLEYCIRYFAEFPFRIPEIRYEGEVLVSQELLQSKLDAGHYHTFQSRRERLEYLARRAIEDYFLLHKEEIRDSIAERGMERNEELSEKEIYALYKRTRNEYVQLAMDGIGRLNRLDSGKQMAEVFARYLRRAEVPEGDEEAQRMFRSLERGKLLYEDALFYLFIKELMGEAAPFSQIYHTVIDESQDYSLLQLYIVRYLFPGSSFTLLGDIYQTVNSVTTMQRYEDYEKVFGSGLVRIRLGRCYRSSSDINALAFRLIDEEERPIAEEYSYFARTVRKPQYVICRDMFSCLGPILERLEKYRSVAVIVDGEEDALAVKAHLQGQKEAQLLISPDDEMKSRLSVIPLLLAKGLEFDAVILFGCIRSNEKNAHMRRKVYLGCTRALHELYFVERETLPEGLRECEGYMEIVDYSREQ
nr:UvrD-helicase domain-containing protein [uncultured Acetatifactor sp.]